MKSKRSTETYVIFIGGEEKFIFSLFLKSRGKKYFLCVERVNLVCVVSFMGYLKLRERDMKANMGVAIKPHLFLIMIYSKAIIVTYIIFIMHIDNYMRLILINIHSILSRSLDLQILKARVRVEKLRWVSLFLHFILDYVYF